MFNWIFSCLYFFLPAYFVNMAPPFAKRSGAFKFLYRPIDKGKKFKGKPILGSHKTWKGIIAGLFVGILMVFFQGWLYENFLFIQKISLIDYSKINLFWFGILISGGALCGDILFAFLKRRLGKEPGAKWLPFDQINYVIGAAIFLTPYLWNISNINNFWFQLWTTLLTLTFILHIIFNRLGYLLKIHQAKW